MRIQAGDKTFKVAEGQYDETWKYVNSGKWEPQTFKILEYFLGADNVMLDLGAWIGAVSLYAAAIGSEVYAVEPDPVAFPELEKNVRQNPDFISKIKCRNLAISGTNGKLTLYARDQYGVSSSSLLPRIRDRLTDLQVDGMTLKAFIEKEKINKIDFIKMDIEGGEFELLPAISDDLKNLNFPTLYISFHYNYLTEHQYYLKVKCRLFSKVLIKLEKWTGIELFGKTNHLAVLKCLQSLELYKYIYTESGQVISHNMILSNPSLIKKHNLVFTNKEWIADNWS
jgi:FkbM family methyltransferase